MQSIHYFQHQQSPFNPLNRHLVFSPIAAKSFPLDILFCVNSSLFLCRCNGRRHFRKIRIPRSAKDDLRWWQRFLESWSAISMIQPSRSIHDVATDASGVKGIGGVYRRHVFSVRIPSRQWSKHIGWKEMYAVLHSFLLWHESWRGGLVRLACDNTAVVDALNNHAIK